MGWEGPLTFRQYRIWSRWLDEQWNVPDRSDHYAMQTAWAVSRSNAKDPGCVRMKDFRLRFEREYKKSPEQAAKWSKMIWFGALGIKQQDTALSPSTDLLD